MTGSPQRISIARELSLVLFILLVYQVGRSFRFGDPFEHAVNIWTLEQAIGIAVEPAMQAWVLDHRWLVTFFAWYYLPVHLVPFLGYFVVQVLRRAPEYPYFRVAAIATILPGLVLYSLWPLAPPRLLEEVGVRDLVGASGAPTLSSPGVVDVANQVAAFPSEHVIWAVVFGWTLTRLHSRKWLPVAVAHVAITCFAVIAMGHHFVVDVVAGLAFAGLTLAVVDQALLVPGRLGRVPGVHGRPAAADEAHLVRPE